MNNLKTFLVYYEKNLYLSVQRYPEDYDYPISEVPEVFARMAAAIQNGTFNKDSRAIKLTCKQLGIKHTYKAIEEFIL